MIIFPCSLSIGLIQWCTPFFGQGPLIGFLNLLGAKQVQQLTLYLIKYMKKFTNMTCAVKHKVLES